MPAPAATAANWCSGATPRRRRLRSPPGPRSPLVWPAPCARVWAARARSLASCGMPFDNAGHGIRKNKAERAIVSADQDRSSQSRMDTATPLDQAKEMHRQGNLAMAEKFYCQVLQADPVCFAACFLD